ncbi:MAG: hypothetical protein ABSC63_21345 [Candidatus Binataceae bacterium]
MDYDVEEVCDPLAMSKLMCAFLLCLLVLIRRTAKAEPPALFNPQFETNTVASPARTLLTF